MQINLAPAAIYIFVELARLPGRQAKSEGNFDMKAFLATMTAAALAASLVLSAGVPVGAAPLYGSPGMNHPTFEQHGSYAMYNNHRGTRHRTPGYRYYNGYYFPPEAFLGLFLGAIASGVHRSAHVQWCMDHYRSYRVSDDTYQPNRGPRRRCVSP